MEHSLKYECKVCNKKYFKEKCFDKHNLFCKIINDSDNDNENNKNLGIHNLGLIVIELVRSNEKFKKDIKELRNWVKIRKQKFIVIDWLNENVRIDQTFDIFLKKINISELDLEIIFKFDLIEGINKILLSIFQKHKENETKLPFKSFDQKDNVIYVFKHGKWEIFTDDDMSLLFTLISKQLMNQFKIWQNKNEYRLYNDEFSSTYINNVKKIIGGSQSVNKQKKMIHKYIYNYLKINLQNIIEYEFS